MFIKVYTLPTEMDKSKASIAALSKDIDEKIAKYKALDLHDAELTELAVLEPAWAEYQVAVAEILTWNDEGNQTAMLASLTGNGRAATVSAAVRGSAQKLRDINIRIAEETKEQADATFDSSVLMIVIISIVAFVLSIGIGIIISGSLSKPLGILVGIATSVSKGDLVRDLDQKVKDSLTQRKDEVGDIAKAFDQVILYMQDMAEVANTISQNNLTATVTPKSEKDELSIAFAKMIESLRGSVGQIAQSASSLGAASEQLAQCFQPGWSGHFTDRYHHPAGCPRYHPAI